MSGWPLERRGKPPLIGAGLLAFDLMISDSYPGSAEARLENRPLEGV
jgi:hypothetical protein